jgi:hypothetical protein
VADVHVDANGGCADAGVDTVNGWAWAWGGVFEAGEEADAGVSSRGRKVVGGVKTSGAAGGGGGGGGGGNKNALGGAKEEEAEADTGESACSAEDGASVLGVGSR